MQAILGDSGWDGAQDFILNVSVNSLLSARSRALYATGCAVRTWAGTRCAARPLTCWCRMPRHSHTPAALQVMYGP